MSSQRLPGCQRVTQYKNNPEPLNSVSIDIIGRAMLVELNSRNNAKRVTLESSYLAVISVLKNAELIP